VNEMGRHDTVLENFLYDNNDINPLEEDAKEQEIEEKKKKRWKACPKCKFNDFVNIMSQPKLYTFHYNTNGNNLFQRKRLAIFFTFFSLSCISYLTWISIPFLAQFSDSTLYVSSQVMNLPMYSSINMKPNETEPGDSLFTKYWQEHVMKERIYSKKVDLT